jgi:Fe-Mn family superoxide dismutase
MSEIQKHFGSWEQFQDQFAKAATGQFGSGWAWLVRSSDGKLAIETTSNAENPLRSGKSPLLTVDVWEHAYYIDYRNDRPKYLQQIWSVLNWEFAEANLKSSGKTVAA